MSNSRLAREIAVYPNFPLDRLSSLLPNLDGLTRMSAQTLPVFLVCGLALLYILPGLLGHDPWKQDEAYIFGCIYHIVQTGDWVVPTLAGEPFMEKPPLYYLVAAALAQLASPWLPLHDGARLASGMFVAITLLAVAWAARRSWGEGYGRGAVLLMLSCLGLLIHAHMMLTDIALLAGFSVAVAGFVACSRSLRWSGLLLGTGIGMTFLAKGLIGPGVIAVSALLLPLLFAEWRNRYYFSQLGWAALAALPWMTIWPSALYLRSPELFHVWFWDNNIGRFFGFSVSTLGAATEPGFWWRTFPSFLFPLWIFAGLVFWKLRRAAWQQPAVQIGITLAVIMALVLVTSASARAIYAMPMVAMLALVGAGVIPDIPRRLERALTYGGIAVGAVAIAFFWMVWRYLLTEGHAPEWSWLDRWLPLDFVMPVSYPEIGLALVLTLGVILLAMTTWKYRARGLVIWCAALVATWGLLATLWLPWIDAAKSYRAMYQDMSLALPAKLTCLSSHGLDESERSMLDYVLGIETYREEVVQNDTCNALLVENPIQGFVPTNKDMVLVWSGTRPGDKRERFSLYRLETRPGKLVRRHIERKRAGAVLG